MEKKHIEAISKAGPEMKAKLLNELGLKGYLVSYGKNPINLFNIANGLIIIFNFILILWFLGEK